jgi:hypothetical protein
MGTITSIETNAPAVRITDTDGNQHVIPFQFFEAVIAGRTAFTNLTGWKKILPQIIKEWVDWLQSGYIE